MYNHFKKSSFFLSLARTHDFDKSQNVFVTPTPQHHHYRRHRVWVRLRFNVFDFVFPLVVLIVVANIKEEDNIVRSFEAESNQ